MNQFKTTCFIVLILLLFTFSTSKVGNTQIGPCQSPPVRIDGATPAYFDFLQDAYGNASDGNTIQSQTVIFYEDLNINRDILVTLKGGYDCIYNNRSGNSIIDGNLTINNGTVHLESIELWDSNLQGSWQYKKDIDSSWQSIEIPGSVVHPSDSYIEFKRSITIPNLSPEQVTKVQFGAVNDGGEVYIDGNLVETIVVNIIPQEVDITDFVQPGSTHILKIRTFRREQYMPAGVFPHGFNYDSLGLTRYVRLAVYPQVHVTDSHVRSSVTNDTFSFDVYVHNHSSNAQLITIKSNLTSWNGDAWSYPGISDEIVTIPADSEIKITIGPISWGLGQSSYWWPNIPFDENYEAQLHNLNLTLEDGNGTVDSFTQRFGFAEYLEGPYYYMINGVKVTQIMDSTQENFFHWESGYQFAYQFADAFRPPDAGGNMGAKESWKRYMRIGFNAIRMHNSIPTEYMLDMADEVGMMIVQETAIRGLSGSEEVWHNVYKPAAVQEVIRFVRSHPSIVRYSLHNEWLESNGADNAKLIDAAVQTDITRPFSLSTCCTDPSKGKRTSSDGQNHAWIMTHYKEPSTNLTEIVGVQEFGWYSSGSKDGTKNMAKSGILYRRNNYATFGPWNWNNYWPNFLEGSSYDNYFNNWAYGDRTDGVDGWGSPIIEFVQRCLHIYASADVDMIQRIPSTMWNPGDPSLPIFRTSDIPTFNSGNNVSREMITFNNSLSSGTFHIEWELRWDAPDGAIADFGSTPDVTIDAGYHDTTWINFTSPGTGTTRKLYFIVKTVVDGAVKFIENEYYFFVI